jgi:Emfourin
VSVKVAVRRRGGFAGNVAVGAELETADLPEPQCRALESAVARLPWGRPAAPPLHPDAFRYEVTLPDDPGRGTAVLGEQDVDEDLAPLLDRLRPHAG